MKRNLFPVGAAAPACALLILISPVALAQTSSDAVTGPGGESVRSTTTPSNAPSVTGPVAPTSRFGSGMLVDRVASHLGQPVDQLTFTVSNKNDAPLKYDFNSAQQFDLVVSDSSGKEVWTWSKGRMFAQLVTHVVIPPGKSRAFTATWNRRDDENKPVPAGVYTVEATLQPLPRLVVSRSATMDPNRMNRDPTNVGVVSPPGQVRDPNSAQSGQMMQSDVAPPVTAKTTITVAG